VNHVRLFLVASLAAVGLILPGSVGARGTVTPLMTATVGSATSPNAYAISLTDATGAKVTHVDPGQYTIVVHDYATLHNFHLSGPGVDQATAVETPEEATWNVTFTDGGTYKYICDAHPTLLRGSFTSGTVVTPPPVKRLVAQVGPTRTLSLRTAAGVRVKRLTAGAYSIKVKDLTKADNFHLTATGVNKKTGVKFRGTVTWKVTFAAGKGTYRSDAHKRLRASFAVVAAS
jgi:plastocyanin